MLFGIEAYTQQRVQTAKNLQGAGKTEYSGKDRTQSYSIAADQEISLRQTIPSNCDGALGNKGGCAE